MIHHNDVLSSYAVYVLQINAEAFVGLYEPRTVDLFHDILQRTAKFQFVTIFHVKTAGNGRFINTFEKITVSGLAENRAGGGAFLNFQVCILQAIVFFLGNDILLGISLASWLHSSCHPIYLLHQGKSDKVQ